MDTQGLEHQNEPSYHRNLPHISSYWGRLSYTPSIEHVVGLKICETELVNSGNVRKFPITSCSREKRYQALTTFPYCKRWKAGRGLGTRLRLMYVETEALVCYFGVIETLTDPLHSECESMLNLSVLKVTSLMWLCHAHSQQQYHLHV